jgi:hypothetical protein
MHVSTDLFTVVLKHDSETSTKSLVVSINLMLYINSSQLKFLFKKLKFLFKK